MRRGEGSLKVWSGVVDIYLGRGRDRCVGAGCGGYREGRAGGGCCAG